MNFLQRIEDYVFWAVTSIVGAMAAGAWWLIRIIFTNQQAVELLRQEIAHRDKLREEDRERMAGEEAGIERIETFLLQEPKR